MKIGRSHKWYYEQGRVEGDENHSRLVADRLRGDQATRRTRAGRIRRSGGYRIPLVHPGASERRETDRERLHDVPDRSQVQDRAQARRQREVERDAANPAQAHDHVPAKCPRRSREAVRSRERSHSGAGDAGSAQAHSSHVAGGSQAGSTWVSGRAARGARGARRGRRSERLRPDSACSSVSIIA